MTDELMDERAYSADDRARMAKSGEAMPDGSYPIANKADLQNAIHAVGRGNGDHNAIRKHIMRRAKALGAMDMIPSNWMADGSMGGSNAARSELLLGSRERRRSVSECEIRSGSNGLLHFEGTFLLFDHPYEVTDRFGTFTETVHRSALERSLNAKPDVVLNVNHEGLPLARTTSATLRLSTSENAGIAVAELDPRDPDVQRVQYKVERGDMPDMSWAFRAIRDTWNEEETQRMLMETSIDGGDVSIVTTGANRATSAGFRSAIDSLQDFDGLLAEVRSETGAFQLSDLRAAYENLGRLLADCEPAPQKTMSVKAALLELMAAS